MLVRRVIEHQVKDYPYAAPVGAVKEALEVFQSAILGVDGGVVRHIVPAVELGRRIMGREPDGVNAQIL